MKKVFLNLSVFFCAITIFTSCDSSQTYRLRTVGADNKVLVIDQNEIKGIRKGDTVQLSQSTFYPYDWRIEPGAVSFSDTTYFGDYIKSNGDTGTYIVSRRIATIEEVIK
jgi:hypothetical protein